MQGAAAGSTAALMSEGAPDEGGRFCASPGAAAGSGASDVLTRDHAADCLYAVCGPQNAMLSVALVESRRTEGVSDLARDHGDACMCGICGPRKLGLDPAYGGFT